MIVPTLTLLVLADILLPGQEPKVLPPDECSADTDCELSTFQGCCGACCPSGPHAIRKGLDEKAKCAELRCAETKCPTGKCPSIQPLKTFRAICRIGQCVAVPKKGPLPPLAPDAPECHVNSECKMVFDEYSEKHKCISASVVPVDPGAVPKDKWGKPLKLEKKAPIPKGARPCDVPDAMAICTSSGRCTFGSKRLEQR